MSNGPQPEAIARVDSEHAHQVALFCWAALNLKQWPELRHMFAIPNGGKRDKRTAANLKAEGVKAGTSDIFLPVARGKWHGLFIELKVGNNKPTPAQHEFLAAMREGGFGACWLVGWEKARDVLLQYLNQK